jgi:hypothetical protein
MKLCSLNEKLSKLAFWKYFGFPDIGKGGVPMEDSGGLREGEKSDFFLDGISDGRDRDHISFYICVSKWIPVLSVQRT